MILALLLSLPAMLTWDVGIDQLLTLLSELTSCFWTVHACKFRYTIYCLSSSIHYIFSMKVLPYSALLDLDKKIRQFPVPSYLQAPIQASEAGRSWSSDPSRACQQYSFLSERESSECRHNIQLQPVSFLIAMTSP